MQSRGLIAPEDVAAVDASGVTLRESLSVVILAVVMRLIWLVTGKIFSAHKDERKNGTGTLLLMLGMVGLWGLGLPSCSPPQMEAAKAAAKAIPVKACYADKNGNRVCYSTKDGIEAEVHGDK